MSNEREKTEVYLNTWGAYNDGFVGFGWMDAETAKNFINENPERAGGEWFIADIDNYTGLDFGNLDYCNVMEILDTIEVLENMSRYEMDEIVAIMENDTSLTIQEAFDEKDNYIFYSSINEYHDLCDEQIRDELNSNELIAQYFDYEAYHRDCDMDITEASNGICFLN